MLFVVSKICKLSIRGLVYNHPMSFIDMFKINYDLKPTTDRVLRVLDSEPSSAELSTLLGGLAFLAAQKMESIDYMATQQGQPDSRTDAPKS